MSQQSEEQAIDQGHECAMSALSSQKDNIDSLPPADRLYWWFGFLTAAMGAALASIGEPAVRALRSALGEVREPQRAAPRRSYLGSGVTLSERGTSIRGVRARTKTKA
jgi:hypothetical protein